MDRFTRGFFGIAVLISLIQTLHAISKDEYDRRISAIKSKPEVAQFLKDNNSVMSQHRVFYEKGADVFTHIRKTKAGAETMDHIKGEVGSILKQEKTNKLIRSILKDVKKVLTSKVGPKNIFAVARFIQDQLQIPKLFDMCTSLEKILISLLVSEDGLDAVYKLMRNVHTLENSPKTAPLLAMLDADLPIIPLPVVYVESEDELDPSQTKEDVPPLEKVPSKKSIWDIFRFWKRDKSEKPSKKPSEKQSKSETSNKSGCFFCRKKKKEPITQE